LPKLFWRVVVFVGTSSVWGGGGGVLIEGFGEGWCGGDFIGCYFGLNIYLRYFLGVLSCF
jgi:hypothetical protein